MALKRRDPFKDLLFLQERMSRIFDEAILRYKGCPDLTGVWAPPVDIYETEEKVIIKVELPGVDIKDVSIEISENSLSIRGERRPDKSLAEENYHRMERFYGSFQRDFTLPDRVDKAGVKADLRDGVLRVALPKLKETARGAVKVRVQ